MFGKLERLVGRALLASMGMVAAVLLADRASAAFEARRKACRKRRR